MLAQLPRSAYSMCAYHFSRIRPLSKEFVWSILGQSYSLRVPFDFDVDVVTCLHSFADGLLLSSFPCNLM